MTQDNKTFFSNLKSDIPSAIVVFLVALPLCLGIALASGAPLFSGIIAGIMGGIVVSLISKSNLGVSGPAAGLVAIVLPAITDLGFEVFLYAVVIAGVLQIVFSMLKAGVIAYYFPSAVIKGMLSGIGIIIILKQIPHAFGYDKNPEGGWGFQQPDGHNTFSEFLYMIDAISPAAVIITAVSLAILILWERNFIKKFTITKWIQGPLLAVIAGVVLNEAFSSVGWWTLTSEHLVNIPVAGGDFTSLFTFPDFSQWNNPQVYVTGGLIAVVASIETLLCVEATDKLDPEKNVTPTNRELLAQGVGNMASGLVGGLPVTQVIVRSSANIQSGAKSRASAFFHGILLIVTAVSIPFLLNKIPLASLAAILIIVGYKLAKPSLIKNMYNRGRAQFVPFAVTILGIVFTDLLLGIGMGLVVAFFQILYNNFKTPYHFDTEEFEEGKPVRIELSEDVSFLNKASILSTLNRFPDGAHIIIDASNAKSIHPDIVEIMDDFAEHAKHHDITFERIGFTQISQKDAYSDLQRTVPLKYVDNSSLQLGNRRRARQRRMMRNKVSEGV